jgi:hypothetical protein
VIDPESFVRSNFGFLAVEAATATAASPRHATTPTAATALLPANASFIVPSTPPVDFPFAAMLAGEPQDVGNRAVNGW